MKIASFLEDINFNQDKPAMSLVLDTNFSKEIRVVFKKGQLMEDHQAPFAIIVHVLKGSINFGINDEYQVLKEGGIIYIKPQEIHNLIALEESVARLTLSKSESLQRVKSDA